MDCACVYSFLMVVYLFLSGLIVHILFDELLGCLGCISFCFLHIKVNELR